MATDVPQRELRNNTAKLLRRAESGERLRVTIHGHPVAALVPLEDETVFVPKAQLIRDLSGLLGKDDPLARELRELDDEPADPFA